MPETAVPDLQRWRALVDQTLRGAPFERRMVRTLPGGLSLPALRTDRPADATSSELIRSLSRDGRWEVSARHAVDGADTAGAIQRDLVRGVDSVWLAGGGAAADARGHLAAVALQETGIIWTDGGTVAERAAVLASVALEQGTDPARCWGAIGADPFDAHLGAGAALPDAAGWAELAAVTRRRAPHLATVGVQGLAVREAGASAATELGVLLASGAATLRGLIGAGLSVAEIASATRLFQGIGRDQLVGIAALRAARLGWARLCGAFGLSDAAASRSPLHGVQLACWQTRHDPWVNLLRSTLAGFVGAVGGADAVTLRAYDAPGGAPSELGGRLATNTQLVLAEESHLAAVRDPAAGSYALEHLTLDLARSAWSVLQAIEAAGGLEAAAGRAVVVDRVREERAALAQAIDRRKVALVGVSDFPGAADQALADGQSAAAAAPLPPVRHAQAWEDLRDAGEARPDTPPVFLATWGPRARHSARAMFTTNLLAAGGLRGTDPGGSDSAADLARSFTASGARVAVICGADADYPEAIPPLAAALRSAGAVSVWVAGRPGAHADAWRAAGVDTFVYTGCDVRACLVELHHILGVSV